jgi:hypothetical protein
MSRWLRTSDIKKGWFDKRRRRAERRVATAPQG